MVQVRAGQEHATLRSSIERRADELRDRRPGSLLVAEHLAHMVLVQALRRHLEDDGAPGGVGWLFALADLRLGAAMAALHADPARRWTLQDLAERASMSRSTFALRFREAVGNRRRLRQTLANAARRRPAGQVSRSGLGCRLVGRIRLRDRLQHNLQARHGLPAPGTSEASREERRCRAGSPRRTRGVTGWVRPVIRT